jgi:tetratricopeptide (TPR) repeat protein
VGAEQAYRRALQLGPSLAAAHQGFAIFLSVHGKASEAAGELRVASELDPISLTNAVDNAAVYYNLRRFDQALETLSQALGRDRSAPALWTWTGIVRGGKKDFAGALEALGKANELGDNTAATLCYSVHALGRQGRGAEAMALLDRIRNSGEFLPGCSLAIALAGLGQTERTLQVLEASYAVRDPLLQYIGVESHFDELHGQPRFQALLNKIGLPVPV